MRKIAIVGVDGSGKTVLMTALGDKYETPDEFGLFLSPENSDAFGYVKLQMDRMRHGMWPGSTIAGKSSVLEWGLFRKSNDGNTRLCDLSFLDFSGEVYRMAFGSKSDHDAAQYDDVEIGESINELRQHIKDADTLAVLINLKDIISGNVGNPRTREAMWLSKSILDYATRELHVPNIAMVFTQADAYRATIAECGGVRGAYEKYLPHVSNIYLDMRLLAVSAVNMTLPDENGIPCPVDGFQSEGLEDLMEWIVSTVPGCETLISDIKTAPLRCREEAWALREEYIVALVGDAKHRGAILDRLKGKLVEMDSAMRAYTQALPQGALDLLRDELQDIGNFEIAYAQLYSEVPSMTDEQISHGVEELCSGSSFAGKVRQKVKEALLAVREAAFAAVARKRRKARWAIVISILVLGAIATGVYFVHAKMERDRIAEARRLEAERQREERALSAEEEASKPKIARGWSYEMRKGHKIAVWRPGAYHSQTWNLKAAEQVDQWISTRSGYVWTTGTNTVWKSGEPYPGNPHCVSSSQVGNWIAAEGYKWAKPNDADSFDVVWNESWKSSDGNKRATSQEGVFEKKINCSSCAGKGRVTGDRWCSNCKGKCMRRDISTKRCEMCDGRGRIESSSHETCLECSGRGTIRKYSSNPVDQAFASIAGAVNPDGSMNFKCGKCSGNGWVYGTERCRNCSGTGSCKEYGELYKWCNQCDDGYAIEDCSNCNGSGKVWRRM